MRFIKWKKEKLRVEALKNDLAKIGKIPVEEKAVFEYAVKFFNIISSFQDEGMIEHAPKKLREAAEELNAHIANAGRQQYGINRTVRGERVNVHNTFWGGVYGMYTCKSAQWMQGDCKRVVDLQVRPFLKSHHQPMLDLIEKLV